MSLVINTNIAGVNSQRHLAVTRKTAEQAMERISSGRAINTAMDDAAGLSISNSLTSRLVSLQQATRNASDGISLTQLAEGALAEVTEMIARMRELAVQSANASYTAEDRASLSREYQELASEITRISENTYFNGISLLGNSSPLNFQVGETVDDSIQLITRKISSDALGTITDLTTTTSATGVAGEYFFTANISTDPGTGAFKLFSPDETIRFDVIVDGSSTVSIDLTMSDLDYYDSANGGINFFDFVDDLSDRISGATVTWEGVGVGLGKIKFSSDSAGSGSSIELANIDFGAGTSRLKLASIVSLDDVSLLTSDSSATAFAVIDNAYAAVDSYRSLLGATANRLHHTVSNLMVRSERQAEARSKIQDADYAVESANLSRSQVLQTAGLSMLAQANLSGRSVIELLK